MSRSVELRANIDSNIGKIAKDTETMADNLKEVNKELEDSVMDLKFMGTSLNDVKSGFIGVTSKAKLMFSSVRAGLISTGIGAFVVAVGSLVAYFTASRKGADKFKQALAGVRSVVQVLIDRFASFGEGIAKIFSGEFAAGAEILKQSMTGIVDEMKEEGAAAAALEKRQQALLDKQRQLAVEYSKNRANIQELKLAAEDTTKSNEDRAEAARKALKLEQEFLERRIALAQEDFDIQNERNNLLDKEKISREDLDALAEKQQRIDDLREESVGKQIELNNKLNALNAEQTAKEDQARADKKAKDEEAAAEEAQRIQTLADLRKSALDDFADSQLSANQLEIKRINDKYKGLMEGDEEYAGQFTELETARLTEVTQAQQKQSKQSLALAKAEAKAKKDLQMDQLDAFGNLAGALSSLFGDNKALAVASATIDTYVGANKAFAQGGLVGYVGAASIIASGLANVKTILSTDAPGVSSGGGGTVSATPPAPEFISGQFDLNNVGDFQEAAPVQAYVITDEMTSSQNKLAQIRRRSTI